MAEVCDLCRTNALEPVYWPECQANCAGRDTVVHLCGHCGLVQSLPRGGDAATAERHNRRKTGRAQASMKLLRAHADLVAALAVLHAGANGETFAQALADAAPNGRITTIEGDQSAAICLSDVSFDIVHSCRLIERLDSPSAALAEYWRALKPGGLLIVDAPNLTGIAKDEIAEEWFADLNRYHFSPVTLGRLLDAAGFDIIGGPDPIDRTNLTFAAVKRATAHRPVPQDLGEVQRAGALIAAYSTARAKNLVALTGVAAELRRLAPRRVAVWGAGKLFDALVTQGGFDPASLALLVDGHLASRADERHGVKLHKPDALEAAAAGIVVVMSRTFAREISRLAQARAPKAEIVLYDDLITRARMALAA